LRERHRTRLLTISSLERMFTIVRGIAFVIDNQKAAGARNLILTLASLL
jgi:hypothetical protein